MKVFYIILGLVVLFLAVLLIFGEETAQTNNDEEERDPQVVLAEEAFNRRGEEGVYLMDVRTVEEWEESHANGAVWWGLEEELKLGNMPEIPTDSEIYVYCRSGNRSVEATQILTDNGFTNVYDVGAFTNWTEVGGPTETGSVKLPS